MRDRPGPSAGRPATSTVIRGGAKDQVLKAARVCFLEHGVRKTTMEKVAAAAGVSRSIVYRLFLDRRELIEAAAAARMAEIADGIAENVPRDIDWDARTLVETFTEVSLAVIQGVRGDPELGVLLADDSPVSLPQVVWMSDVAQRGTQFWRPCVSLVTATLTDVSLHQFRWPACSSLSMVRVHSKEQRLAASHRKKR